MNKPAIYASLITAFLVSLIALAFWSPVVTLIVVLAAMLCAFLRGFWWAVYSFFDED